MSFMTKDQIMKRLQGGEMITPKYIQYLIEEHLEEALSLKSKYEYYTAKSLDIQLRRFEDTTKINNHLNNDFMGNIIDQSVGYLFGKNIMYGINQEKYAEAQYNELMSLLDDFITRNDIYDLDSETGKYSAICGTAFRLCYHQKYH